MSLDCLFKDDGAHVYHNGEDIALFAFNDFWDLITVTVRGETYNVNCGYASDEEINRWMRDDPAYGLRSYGSTEAITVTRRIAYGIMLCIGIVDGYGMWPSRVIAKVVEYDDDGSVTLSIYDGDPEKEDIFEF